MDLYAKDKAKEEDFILAETVKLLNVTMGLRSRVSQVIANFFVKVRS